MDEIKEPATEITTEVAPTIAPEEDLEAKYVQLEEEKENYRKAYLKEAAKRTEPADEEEDAKIDRKVQEAIANSKLAEIAREQDGIIKQTLKENKELKLAALGNKEPPAAIGSHSETVAVTDTSITPEQMAYFKSRNWTDKDIERYRANLRKKP